MSISRCDICYEYKATACADGLTLEAGLTALTVYTVFLEDRYGHFHTQEITTTAQGDFALDLTAFDAGMFTAYSGSYELSVSTETTYSTYETLVINSVSYPCVKVMFYNVD